MRFLYSFAIEIMAFAMRLLARFDDKICKGIEGRRNSCSIVSEAFDPTDEVLWMHAASLGEYEQGLPVLEELKLKYPSYKVLITFFSASGYENVINKKHPADAICYLPFDEKDAVREFLDNFNPVLFFTVKYDYWYNLLEELKIRGTKIYVVSALFYETQIFFRMFGKWFINRLKLSVDWFFHQTPHSMALAKSVGLTNSSTTGDTRFDRVKQLLDCDNEVPGIKRFKGDKKLLVFGSSWQAEEKILQMVALRNKDLKLIIAPHDLKRVTHIQELFGDKAVLYSQIPDAEECAEDGEANMDVQNFYSKQVLVIDCIGLLSKIYSYADLAIIGGGFHSHGLHNILEAATFSVPVIFGEHYQKNPEADGIIAHGGGKAFSDEVITAEFILRLLENEEQFQIMAHKAGEYVHSQRNATDLIVHKISADFSPN